MEIYLKRRPPTEKDISGARQAINKDIGALKTRLLAIASGASVVFAGFFFFTATRSVSLHFSIAGAAFCFLCLRMLMPEILDFAGSIDTLKSSLGAYRQVSASHNEELLRFCLQDPLVCDVYAKAVAVQERLMTVAESRAITSYVKELLRMQNGSHNSRN